MKRFLFATLLFFPALAAASGAGFASGSVFLSQASVTEGESVYLYASLANPSSAPFQGNIVFNDSGKDIGSVAVSLAAGSARVVSISWTPAAGSHEITAKLVDARGASVASESDSFDIAPRPKLPEVPPSDQPAAVDSSQPVQEEIAKISPQAASASKPVFSALDGAREQAANFLDSQLAVAKEKLPGQVLGAETSKNAQAPNGVLGWLLSVLWTIYFYLLTVLRFIVGSAAYFYPILAILFIYFFYRLYRRMRGGYQY